MSLAVPILAAAVASHSSAFSLLFSNNAHAIQFLQGVVITCKATHKNDAGIFDTFEIKITT